MKHPPSSTADLSGWLTASNDCLVVVAFVAEWAGGAMILRGFLTKIERELSGIDLRYVDIDQHPALAAEMAVNQVPTVVLLRNQTVVDHIDGVIPRRKLIERIEPHL